MPNLPFDDLVFSDCFLANRGNQAAYATDLNSITAD
jgi:hypothetical protein